MKNGIVVADSGPIYSLVLINKLSILDSLFSEVKIPEAVWNEITFDKTKSDYPVLYEYFKDKTCKIAGINELTFVMDYGESESLILFKEINADFLLIDDKKARNIAENFNINCIGTIGILIKAKERGLINKLKPIFETFLLNKRYYSVDLLNTILISIGEEGFNIKI
ncbi:MAG: DUF3368 domain-containing protein [Bacteroidota bacterium]